MEDSPHGDVATIANEGNNILSAGMFAWTIFVCTLRSCTLGWCVSCVGPHRSAVSGENEYRQLLGN